jgi:uncharacterized membrane protein YcaP (DUF421 family)
MVIIQNGAFIDANLKRELLAVDEVQESIRLKQIGTVADVEWGILESNGEISFIEKRQKGCGCNVRRPCREMPARNSGGQAKVHLTQLERHE